MLLEPETAKTDDIPSQTDGLNAFDESTRRWLKAAPTACTRQYGRDDRGKARNIKVHTAALEYLEHYGTEAHLPLHDIALAHGVSYSAAESAVTRIRRWRRGRPTR